VHPNHLTTISEFYDPHLYGLNVGLSPRVDLLYDELVHTLGTSQLEVAELGCGIGNVLEPILRRGHIVHGVDSSERMLEACEQRLRQVDDTLSNVHLHQSLLPSLPSFDKGIDAVIAPNDIVSHMLDASTLRALFHAVYQALRPSGTFWLDFSPLDVDTLGQLVRSSGQTEKVHGFYHYPEEKQLRVSENSSYDPGTRILTAHFKYELLNKEHVVELTRYRTLRLYPRTLEEVTQSLTLAGFSVLETRPRAIDGLPNILVHASKPVA
jgi:SAM-dependent methyltransferase